MDHLSKFTFCPPGTGHNGRNYQNCDRFLFNDGKDGSCQECPTGFAGNRPLGSTRCVLCPTGTFQDSHTFACKPCKPGEDNLVTGATFCLFDNTPCPSNLFRNFREACEKCTRRQRYSKSKNTCQDCGTNEESEGGLATKSTKCP